MASSYEFIDEAIDNWAIIHSLKLNKIYVGREIRSVYVSSVAGECFHIWIAPPSDEHVLIGAECVEGRREDNPDRYWKVPPAELGVALENVFQTVISWMLPSHRHLPNSKS